MSDPLVVQALKDKRAEIHGRIGAYQAQIAEAKYDRISRTSRSDGDWLAGVPGDLRNL